MQKLKSILLFGICRYGNDANTGISISVVDSPKGATYTQLRIGKLIERIRFRFQVLKHKSGWWRGSWWAFAIFPIEFFDIACPVIYLLCEKPPESTQVPARGFNAAHYTSKRNFHPFFIHLAAENFWIASNRSMSVEKRMIALGNSVINSERWTDSNVFNFW